MKNMILEAAEEAISIAVCEGIVHPLEAEKMTEDDLVAWYDKQMDFEPEEETPF